MTVIILLINDQVMEYTFNIGIELISVLDNP